MADNQQEKKTVLSLSSKGQLGLKKPLDQPSQTRSTKGRKTVTVEVKRKRISSQQEESSIVETKKEETSKPSLTLKASKQTPKIEHEKAGQSKSENLTAASLRGLSEDERAHRLKILQESIREEERQRQEKLEEERRHEEERLQEEQLQLQKVQEETKAKEELKKIEERQKEAEKELPKEETTSPSVGQKTIAAAKGEHKKQDVDVKSKEEKEKFVKPVRHKEGDFGDDEEASRGSRNRRGAEKTDSREKWDAGSKRTLARQFAVKGEEDEDQAPVRGRSMASIKRAREKERKKLLSEQKEQQKIVREVIIPEIITVQDLANRMAERSATVIRELMKMGVMATINQPIDADTAELVVTELGHKAKRVSESDIETTTLDVAEDEEGALISRAPVVTIMGHVDHGKTSLLDALRETDVAAGEAGGITQHIGAYSVKLPVGKRITFIDTPGHAAFSEMRARGANITDIVVLVVAADDGVKQQTIEAIHHAQAANVPIIVAINKIDVPGADPNRVATELMQHNIYLENMGGQILSVQVSAKKRLNLDVLEETILLQAEMLELKANPSRKASGAVIEAKQEKGRGSVATVLIQKGTLQVGDPFIAGCEWGRVRALLDDKGRKIDSAGPSTPVEVLGLVSTPVAGDDFMVVENETKAREVAEFRTRRKREKEIAASARGSLEQMFSQIAAGERKDLPLIIKSDVHGSLEAILGSLEKVSTEEVKAKILHAAVGSINESDVALARASHALIVGFNVRANPQARDLARRDNIDIRYYSIIYNLIDDVKSMLSGLLAPTLKEKFLGYAEIRQVFNITRVGKVAGCYVTEGVVKRGAKVRLLRDNVVIHEGNLKTLKRFKDELREVKEGFECGMAFENYNDIQEKDVIECFEVEEIARSL